MKKAKERALEAYPVDICGYVCECRVGAKPEPMDYNEKSREAFKQGYEQAEKDLGWHSVGDSLPERNHFVLVCVEDEGVPQCIGMAMLRDDGIWWDGEDLINVDYWMEVPKLKK